MRLSLITAFFALSSLEAAEPIIDVYVSTGDNHFLGSSLPIDSPASIEATFDLFRDVQHARRIYWRGLESSCWLETMHARPENPRSYSFWEWLNELYETVSPDSLAVEAARKRGMEIWGMGSRWDWGGPADTPGFGDYPFAYESKLKLEHPEWAPLDRHGARRQGGPIELAYLEARKTLVDLPQRMNSFSEVTPEQNEVAIWQGTSNLYDFKSLRVAQTSFTRDTFTDFQKRTGSEADSRWEDADDAALDGIGADESKLPEPARP